MASYGFEPFDDDDAIDWITNLAVGDFASIKRQLEGLPQQRETWAALGLVSSLINSKITLPNDLQDWRSQVSGLSSNLLNTAKVRVEEVYECVSKQLEQGNMMHDMAKDEWDLIRNTLLNQDELPETNKQQDSDTAQDEHSDFVCVYCNDAISAATLLNISLSKNGPVGIDMHAHEACFAKHLQGDLKLLLNNL